MKSRVNSGTWRSEVKPKQMNWIKQDEIKHEEEPEYNYDVQCGKQSSKESCASGSCGGQSTYTDAGGNRSFSLYYQLLNVCSIMGKEEIEVVGKIIVTVSYKNVEKEMPPIIVKGDGPSLFGRDWLLYIPLDWKEITFIQDEPIKSLIANILI